MDEFGCFDYKTPVTENTQDMRTSYYRSHRYLTDLRLGNKTNASFHDPEIYVSDPLIHEKLRSDYGRNYEWKYIDPNTIRNPTMNMKMQFMKPFEQGQLRFIKRPIKPMSSVTQDTYGWTQLPREPDPSPIYMPTPVEATKLELDRSKISDSKYLDPSATTYNLSYVHYQPRDIQRGIAAQDNITFWNWNELFPVGKRVISGADEQMCDDFPAKKCPKRRCEYQNQLKPVPHTGQITEMRQNYRDPKYRDDYIEFETTDVRPLFLSDEAQRIPQAKVCENSLYGSGEPVARYV
ncbi:uncharacterized protein LOC115632040 [Scaptodrosophila lebanonensis]|uniref:Uncharacterized protein LOC115632040 n=1 Tax=Drosophila lebanonensis TaxID=7225 RepID=A0A6J2UCI4_DROLE|nr:uncharacterized protein LOC115632040 [Scaptodrosophila lebanonensis]